ncbi:MAG TPA: NAD(P)(+) transhydrogenase (Re/Si-specific) subunit beta, partial [Chitinophagaceae bacterium]|nr:NAD(P)(+) transhydrogenase (Re/Si-specific) subunit beta [Chitinophagaceae bacterium]
MEINILTICYLIGSVTFIIGLKMLSHPEKARRGNLIAAGGMIIAILGTIFLYRDDAGNKLHNYVWIFGGIIIGGTIGTLAAKKVKMTAMPEMVSIFNGMGGACAAIISALEFYHIYRTNRSLDSTYFSDVSSIGQYLTIIAGAIIGTISYTGSIIGWGKLSGKIKDFSFKGQHIFNLLVFGIMIALAVYTYNANIKIAIIPLFLTGLCAFIYGIL